MATAAKRSGNSGIFWMNGVSDDEQPLVFVPRVDGEGRTLTPFGLGPGSTRTAIKRSTKMGTQHTADCKTQTTQKKGGKKQGQTAYAKEKMPSHHSAPVTADQPVFLPSDTFLQSSQVMSETSRAKSEVCLKDLCPEDKRRIANLIKELARVSEEKEESVQRLKDEQDSFERKIQQLEQQNLLIAQERESLQQQYRECQELLSLYQQYLSQQQARLNQSIAQLSQPLTDRQVHSSEDVPSRASTGGANGLLFDGSYLSFAATEPNLPPVNRRDDGRRGAVQTFRNPASLSGVNGFGTTNGPVGEHMNQKRECRGQQACHTYEHHQHRCCDARYGMEQQKTDDGSCLVNGCHDTLSQYTCDRPHSEDIRGSEATEALTRPLLGQEDWEEKRHQLLLQKMQLEVERERLQARLAEQEERLHRQNQQLCQSQLDYSRFKEARAEHSSSDIRNGCPKPQGPSHQASTSSVCEEQPARQNLHENHSQPVPSDNGNAAPSERPRKDMATSPARTPAATPTSVSVTKETVDARLDFSLAELLDIFSPVSAPEKSKPAIRRPKLTQQRPSLSAPRPGRRTLLTPRESYARSTQQDLEESQILEDIFFIC
ncbi:protein hinderin isoform 2-T2 [Pholidichthys leucotaenia]